MVKNHKLAQAIGDASFGELSRQLAYKCLWNGVELIKADQWFPSSKICSCCGNKKDVLKLSERIYKCEKCGLEIDRDLNAAKNLANYSPTPKSGGSQAFGERAESRKVQSSSEKNEINN
jgi:putative transposase